MNHFNFSYKLQILRLLAGLLQSWLLGMCSYFDQLVSFCVLAPSNVLEDENPRNMSPFFLWLQDILPTLVLLPLSPFWCALRRPESNMIVHLTLTAFRYPHSYNPNFYPSDQRDSLHYFTIFHSHIQLKYLLYTNYHIFYYFIFTSLFPVARNGRCK